MLRDHQTWFPLLVGLAMSGVSCSSLLAGQRDPVAEVQAWYADVERLGPIESEKPPLTVREAYVAQHPELDLGTKNLLLSGSAFFNMTPEQVKVAWGEPISIGSITGRKVYEVWRYPSNEEGLYTLIYFLQGVVVGRDLVTSSGRVVSTEHSGLY